MNGEQTFPLPPLPLILWKWHIDSTPKVGNRQAVTLTSRSRDASDERVFEVYQLCISAIPTLAIDQLEVEYAQIEIPVEQLMVRLGQLVICTTNNIKQDDPIITFEIDSHTHCSQDHPGFIVMSQHLIPLNNDNITLVPDIPVVKLLAGKHIRAKCHAIWTTGLEHSSRSPIGGFKYSLLSNGGEKSETTTIEIELTGAISPSDLIKNLERLVVKRGLRHQFIPDSHF